MFPSNGAWQLILYLILFNSFKVIECQDYDYDEDYGEDDCEEDDTCQQNQGKVIHPKSSKH